MHGQGRPRHLLDSIRDRRGGAFSPRPSLAAGDPARAAESAPRRPTRAARSLALEDDAALARCEVRRRRTAGQSAIMGSSGTRATAAGPGGSRRPPVKASLRSVLPHRQRRNGSPAGRRTHRRGSARGRAAPESWRPDGRLGRHDQLPPVNLRREVLRPEPRNRRRRGSVGRPSDRRVPHRGRRRTRSVPGVRPSTDGAPTFCPRGRRHGGCGVRVALVGGRRMLKPRVGELGLRARTRRLVSQGRHGLARGGRRPRAADRGRRHRLAQYAAAAARRAPRHGRLPSRRFAAARRGSLAAPAA